MKERWSLIPGSKYWVSDAGQVRSPRKTLSSRSHNGRGYPHVCIYYDDGRRVLSQVHRLVASAFCDNPHGHEVVNHRDGNKSNNRATNLEWCTHRDNREHAIATGLASRMDGEHNPRCVLNEMQVRVIRRCIDLGLPGPYIANAFGVSNFAVYAIKHGRTWSGGILS